MTREDEIFEKIEGIEKLLLGNGKIGVAEMARRSFEYCENLKLSKQGLIDWVFRIVLSIIVGYIAVQVGLR